MGVPSAHIPKIQFRQDFYKIITKFVALTVNDMSKIKLYDKVFKPFIPNEDIMAAIDSVAAKIDRDFNSSEKPPILLCVLNGSIMFTSELMKRLEFPLQIVSIKLASYAGTSSTGKVREVMGLTSDVKGRDVIIVEDIVDTGHTIMELKNILKGHGATGVKVCTMLFKPGSYKYSEPLDYVGKEIPNDFIVGFGLDYDELGRNYKDIYILDEEETAKLK